MKKLLKGLIFAFLGVLVACFAAACNDGNASSYGTQTPSVPEQPESPDGNKPDGNEPTQTPDGNKPTAPEQPEKDDILIVYFSWSGNTERMVNYIAQRTGGDVVEIEAAVPYSTNYTEVAYGRAQDEWKANARPEVAQSTYDKIDMSKYDTVFVGFPIWWHTAPMIIGTFLEHYAWSSDVDIYPFFQGASNSNNEYYANSMEFVRSCANDATVHDGLYAASTNTTKIDEYLTSNGF